MDTNTLEVLTSSASVEWATPQEFFDQLDARFGPFDLDPAATPENAKCRAYFTAEDDGLNKPWEGRVFCNPPYGRDISTWVYKAASEVGYLGTADAVVMLIPVRTDTVWWQEFVMHFATSVYLVRGRLKFGDSSNSAPFPSAVVIFERGTSGPPVFRTIGQG